MPLTLELLLQDCWQEGFDKGYQEGLELARRELICEMDAKGRSREYICAFYDVTPDYVDEVLREAADPESGNKPAESDK